MTTRTTIRKQMHLGAHFPGVNNTTVWSDPRSGSHIQFESFAHFARTAERAKFDFLFLAEGLRLREQGGQIYDLDVVGRPDTFTVLAALAGGHRPAGAGGHHQLDVQRAVRGGAPVRDASTTSPAGRAAWNVVTSWDAFTGENFRRGGFLPQEERYRAGPAVHVHGLGAVRFLAGRRDRRPTSSPGRSFPIRAPVASNTTTTTSTSPAGSTCRAALRADRSSSRRGIRMKDGTSRPRPRTPSSRGTAASRPAGRSTPT